MIRAVIFDIGGVLELTPGTGWIERWESLLQLPNGAIDERMAETWSAGAIGLISEERVIEQTQMALGLTDVQLGNFMNDLWTDYLGSHNSELAAYFSSLRPRYRTAMLSNSFVGAREREQSLYGYGDICDAIIYSHEVGMSKPDHRIYALTCSRLGIEPGEAIFLDDNNEYVFGAQAIGMHAIQFRHNSQAIAEIEELMKSVMEF